MFHAFNVVVDDAVLDSEELEKVGQQPMPTCDLASQPFTSRGENESTVLLVFQQAFGIQALNHVRDTGLGDAQSRSNIDHAGITLAIDQFQNSLEVILDCGRTAKSR